MSHQIMANGTSHSQCTLSTVPGVNKLLLFQHIEAPPQSPCVSATMKSTEAASASYSSRVSF